MGAIATFLAVALLSVTFLSGCSFNAEFGPHVLESQPESDDVKSEESEVVDDISTETVVHISTETPSGRNTVTITESLENGVRIDIQ